jgi:hypothetical protein
VNNLYKRDCMTHRNSPWSIAYFSRASAPLSDKQLYELAARAESRNRQLSVSGVLLVRNNHFFQVLEGHVGFVSDLYQQIAADPRHTSVTKVLDAPIARPAFSGWPMRLITTEDISLEELDIVGRALDALERHAGDETRNLDLAALVACSNALVRGVYRRPVGAIAC